MQKRLKASMTASALALGVMAGAARTDADGAKLDAVVTRFMELSRDASGGVTASTSRRVAAFRAMRDELQAIPVASLAPEQQIDWMALKGQIAGALHDLEVLRAWEKNPEIFVQFGSVAGALAQDAPPATRADRAIQQLNVAVAALSEAKTAVKTPVRRFTGDAIYQAGEWRTFLKTDVAAFAATAGDARARLEAANEAAIAALDDFLAFARTDLLPRSNASFAIGREEYARILAEHWFMDAGPDEILARGRRAFDETERLAQQVAERIRPGRPWIEVYDEIKNDHPPADRLKEEYQAQMDAAQAFLKKHEIVTLPPGERVITVDTPPARRRSSPFGTFSSVGPFDKELLGRLVLTPIEDHLTPEQRRERLRSHHRAWIPIIAVHEAYPGHHVQALKANENPRILRRVIRESIFSEGWGLFTEEMMFEQGFLKGDDVRLTQLRNRLWRAARVIIDVGLHTGAMTFEDGVKFLVEKVRFEPYAAELEVGMYTRRPTFVLGYLIGMLEIQEMRAAYEKKFGKPAKPHVFYDKLLRIGALPPSLVRAELLGEPVRARETRVASESIAGLWSYETLTPAKGRTLRPAGFFLFKDGHFVQEALNEGEPFDQQAVQAHAGTYSLAGTVRLAADVQLGVNPLRTPAVSSSPGRTHQLTPERQGDHLTLTFGSGTVQTFRRVGPGSGELVLLERGILALVDGRFLIVAEDGGRHIVGAGRFERQGGRLALTADRWMTSRDGRPRYQRQVRIEAVLEDGELRLPGEAPFRVRVGASPDDSARARR